MCRANDMDAVEGACLKCDHRASFLTRKASKRPIISNCTTISWLFYFLRFISADYLQEAGPGHPRAEPLG